jgi:hypothetical protein
MVKELKKRVTDKRRLLLYHILAWSFFMLYETSAMYGIRHYISSFGDVSVHYMAYIVLFYSNAHFVFLSWQKLLFMLVQHMPLTGH